MGDVRQETSAPAARANLRIVTPLSLRELGQGRMLGGLLHIPPLLQLNLDCDVVRVILIRRVLTMANTQTIAMALTTAINKYVTIVLDLPDLSGAELVQQLHLASC